MKILSKFETLHSHHPLKMKIAKVEQNTYFPSGKYLIGFKTQKAQWRCCLCASLHCSNFFCVSYVWFYLLLAGLWHIPGFGQTLALGAIKTATTLLHLE
jgi:hypothetical protein